MPSRIFRYQNNLHIIAAQGAVETGIDGGVLTTGKPAAQAESLPWGSDALTRPYIGNDNRLLRLRWLALMMELAPDLGRYTDEFKKTVLLLDGQFDPAAEERDLPQVGDLNRADLIFSYFPKEDGRIGESDFRDLA